MPHIRGAPTAGHSAEEDRRAIESRTTQAPVPQAPPRRNPFLSEGNPFLEFMRTPVPGLGVRPEQYFDPMLTILRYLDRAVRTSGLPIGSVLPMTGALGPRAMIEAPGEQFEAFKAFLEPAMRGDWDAAIAAYQDEITPTLPWQDPGGKIPGYWGAMEIPSAFIPTGGPFVAGTRIASKAPAIARAAAKLAPAAARPAVYRGVRKTAEPVGKAMMAPWQLENLAGEMAIRGAVKGVKGVGRGAGWLGGRARRGAAEAAVRVPGGEGLGLKIAGVQPIAGGANGVPFAQLPRELRGAKPNYNMGPYRYSPQFESDIDKSLFIISQRKKSPHDESYMDWLRDQLPDMDDIQIRDSGRRVRNHIKETLRGEPEGDVFIPASQEVPVAAPVVPTDLPTAAPVTRAIAKEPWQMTKAEFEEAATRGKLIQATGKETAAERRYIDKAREIDADPTPFGLGESAGYAPEDIAHFYVKRRYPGWRAGEKEPPIVQGDYDPIDVARMEYIDDAYMEGKPVSPHVHTDALWRSDRQTTVPGNQFVDRGGRPVQIEAPPTARVSGLTPDEVNKLARLKGRLASDEAALNDLLTDAEYMTRFATRGVKPRPYTVRYPGSLPGDEGYRPPTKLVYTKSERLKNIKEAEESVRVAKTDVDTVKKEISDEKAIARQAGEAPDSEDMADLNQQLSDARDALSDARGELKVAKQSTAYTAKEKAWIAAADKLDVEYPRDLRVRIKSGQKEIDALEARQVAGVTPVVPTAPPTPVAQPVPTAERVYTFTGTRTVIDFSEKTGRPLTPRKANLKPIKVKATSREEAVQKIRYEITNVIHDPSKVDPLSPDRIISAKAKTPQVQIAGKVREVGLKPGRTISEILDTFDYFEPPAVPTTPPTAVPKVTPTLQEALPNLELERIKQGQVRLFHGSPTAFEGELSAYSYGARGEGLYGPGVYLTTDPKIASGYARPSKAAKGLPAGNVRPVTTNLKKMFDVDAPADKDILEGLQKTFADHLEDPQDRYNVFTNIELSSASEKLLRGEVKNPTNDQLYKMLVNISEGTDMFPDEFRKAYVMETLQEHGYDSITHIGGKIRKGPKHRVVIVFDDPYTGKTTDLIKPAISPLPGEAKVIPTPTPVVEVARVSVPNKMLRDGQKLSQYMWRTGRQKGMSPQHEENIRSIGDVRYALRLEKKGLGVSGSEKSRAVEMRFLPGYKASVEMHPDLSNWATQAGLSNTSTEYASDALWLFEAKRFGLNPDDLVRKYPDAFPTMKVTAQVPEVPPIVPTTQAAEEVITTPTVIRGGLANLSTKYGISQRILEPIYDDVYSAVSQTTGDYASRKAAVIDYMAEINPRDGLATHYDIPTERVGDEIVRKIDVNDIIDDIIDEYLPPPTAAPIVKEVPEEAIAEVISPKQGVLLDTEAEGFHARLEAWETAQLNVDQIEASPEAIVNTINKISNEPPHIPDSPTPTGIGSGGGITTVGPDGAINFTPQPSISTMMANMFRDDVWRRISNLPVIRHFLKNSPLMSNPAAVANSPADKLLVMRSAYRYYADQKAEILISRVKQLGSEESIWGKMDDTGKLTEGPFEGMFLNDIRTQRLKLSNRMTPEMKSWIKSMEELEAAKLKHLKDNNIRVHELEFEDGGVYAGRRVFGKVGKDGKIIETKMVGGKRPGAKMPEEKRRKYATQEDAVRDGFRYLSETDTLYMNIKGAYRRVDDKDLVEWFLEQPSISYRNISTSEGVPALTVARKVEKGRRDVAADLVNLIYRFKRKENLPSQSIRRISRYFPEEGERLKKLVADKRAGIDTADEVDSFIAAAKLLKANRQVDLVNARLKLSEAKGRAREKKFTEGQVMAPAFNDIIFTGDDALTLASSLNDQFSANYHSSLAAVNKVNALLRFFQLSGDASPFGIHLIFMAGRPDIYLKSGAAFVRALFDPTFASKQKRNIPQELLEKHPGIQWATGGTEITEALGTGGLLMSKPFKLLGAPLQPFARGFESALDVAGIELMKSLDRYATTPQRAFEVDNFINKFRGMARSDRLGVTETGRAVENLTFLASSYNRAIAALMFDLSRGNLSGHLARVNLARGLTAISAMAVVISYSMGESTKDVIDHLNPRSPNFMTWNVGGTRLGPGSKVRSIIKLLADTSKDPDSLLERSMENPGLRFLRGNLAPVASDGLDILVGSTYIGDPIDTPLAFGKEILAPALMPIWIQSTALEGGTFGERLTRGGVEFLGGRAYPASPLGETARKKFGRDYNELEYYQKEEVREDDEVQEHFGEQENRTGVKNRYFSHINAVDDEHMAKMNAYITEYGGDKSAIKNAYYSDLQYFRGQRDGIKRALEPGFNDPDINDKDLGERAMAEYFSLFDNPSIKSPTGNIIWDNYETILSGLENKWAKQTRLDPQNGQRESVIEYVRRNTNLTPIPPDLLPYLAKSTRLKIERSNEARERHRRSIGTVPVQSLPPIIPPTIPTAMPTVMPGVTPTMPPAQPIPAYTPQPQRQVPVGVATEELPERFRNLGLPEGFKFPDWSKGR